MTSLKYTETIPHRACAETKVAVYNNLNRRILQKKSQETSNFLKQILFYLKK